MERFYDYYTVCTSCKYAHNIYTIANTINGEWYDPISGSTDLADYDCDICGEHIDGPVYLGCIPMSLLEDEYLATSPDQT